MISLSRLSYILLTVLLAATSPANAQNPAEDTELKRGEYVLQISGCVHCHTAEEGARLAGGHALETPFGVFYTPNITAHKSTGIGNWSAEDFERALRHGVAPDGGDYYPAFPYTSYTRLSVDDVNAMYAYLMSLPGVDQANRDHDLAWFLQWRIAATAWKWLFFEAGEMQPQPERSALWNRGAYIAEAKGHCGECHTPRNLFGALRSDLAYAGNPEGPDDELVPNITPHATTGIGDWSRDDLVLFLQFGELPDGEYTAGSMDPVIQGMNKLTVEDRSALVEYLRELPPIDNKVSQ